MIRHKRKKFQRQPSHLRVGSISFKLEVTRKQQGLSYITHFFNMSGVECIGFRFVKSVISDGIESSHQTPPTFPVL